MLQHQIQKIISEVEMVPYWLEGSTVQQWRYPRPYSYAVIIDTGKDSFWASIYVQESQQNKPEKNVLQHDGLRLQGYIVKHLVAEGERDLARNKKQFTIAN